MKVATLATACLLMTLGLALADFGGYGDGYGQGGYSYMPMSGGYGGYGGYGGAGGGAGSGGFLMLIGLLFLLMFLFNGNLFNRTSSSSTPTISILQG